MPGTASSPERPNHITQIRFRGVSVLRPTGAIDRNLADEIRERCLDAHAPVVIDLTDCELTDITLVRRIAVEWQFYRPSMCMVTPHQTARQQLRQSGIDQEVHVFDTVEEAVQVFGWRAHRSPRRS